MRFARTITALLAAFTATLLGLTLAPAQAAESIQTSATSAEQTVAARGVTPRAIVINDCRCTTKNARTKPLWATFRTDPLAAGVRFRVFVKRSGSWRLVDKGRTHADGVTKKFTFRSLHAGTTRYKVVAKGDAVYAKAVKKIPVTRTTY